MRDFSLPQRPQGLPKFDNPPLREVAIAVLFQPLEGLAQPHVGRYWEVIRDGYPGTADQPPIDPYLEGESRGQPAFQLLVGPPPLRRSWFVSADGERLVQLQSDRFVHNWRGDGLSYPQLEDLWASFAERFQEFAAWIEDEGIGSVEPFQLELTYVNYVEAATLWDVIEGEAPGVTTEFAHDVTGTPEAMLQFRYAVEGESKGSLYVHCRQVDEQLQQIELTYRAVLKSPTVESMVTAVAAGRRLIVTHFTELTRPTFHAVWERIQ